MSVVVSSDKPGNELSTMKMALVICSRLFLLAGLLVSSWASAQEGHPYEGTWRGTITMDATTTPVVMIIDYDGEKLNGMINPGRSSYKFATAEHDAPNWRLTVTSETRDGIPVSFTAVMKDIGSVKRYMEGTWTQGGKEYPFRITRE